MTAMVEMQVGRASLDSSPAWCHDSRGQPTSQGVCPGSALNIPAGLRPLPSRRNGLSTDDLYVDDIDATYQRALEAGAVSLEEPEDMPYGDRRGMIKTRAATSGKSPLARKTSAGHNPPARPPPRPSL
jgi:hypothetical protein